METAVGSEVANHRNAPFWTVPESVENADVLLSGAKALPVRDPAFEDFANLSVANRYFFDTVNLQRRPMKHLLYRTRCRFEHGEGDHLIKAKRLRVVPRVAE